MDKHKGYYCKINNRMINLTDTCKEFQWADYLIKEMNDNGVIIK